MLLYYYYALTGGDWVHVPNTQIDIYAKTRNLLNTGVG